MTRLAALDDCRWHDDGNPAARQHIIAFLGEIGVPIRTGAIDGSVLAGMTVRHGAIVVDPAQPAWAGDLLHEAGHLALTDPALRAASAQVSEDAGEEMAAIAWSYAALVHLGIAADVVFHRGGYRGAAASLATGYRSGGTMGVPILAMHGMTAEPHRAKPGGIAPYPAMQRWLR